MKKKLKRILLLMLCLPLLPIIGVPASANVGDDSNDNNEDDPNSNKDGNNNGNKKTYTEDEVNALIDSRISKAYAKWSKQQEKAVLEAERLSKMSEEERQKAKIEQLEKDLAEKEKAINIRENKIVCMAEMEKRNIPTSLIDFIVTDDADSMHKNLNIFEKTLKKLVDEEVSKRLNSTVPKNGNISSEGMTKEKFKMLSLAEQAELYTKDKELYLKMIQ